MNVVLYSADFEPITIIDLPLWLLEQLEKQGSVKVAVHKPISPSAHAALDFEPPSIVNIYCEKLRWKDGMVKPVLITHDEELALTLRPDWLPGQRNTINGYQKAIRHLTDSLVKAMRK